ncbi:hypothetical protein [Streptomyces sp. NPDC056056]|uniref:hypothetical protein n=1 Tax=Streptomyces sp. NPDC056056 TaxID=3345698 RepID=UPI0035D76C00
MPGEVRPQRVRTLRHIGFAGLADAAAYARGLLTPLTEPPTENLLAFTPQQRWDRTAVALGVHRNTVRQRVA